MDELNELDARVARLPDDAQWELAWRILRRFGHPTPDDIRAQQEAMRADIEALAAWEKEHGKMFPTGAYRAAG